jgi:hypothetical protein
MGEYRTPGSEGWTLWGTSGLALLALGILLGVAPARPLPGLVWWESGLAVCAACALMRTWTVWRRVPIVVRLGENHMSARRGDGILFAEIPYAAIAAIRDPFWSGTIVIYGADRASRIEIPLATKGIRELLTALAEHIPPYLWDLERSRSFGVPVPWILMGIAEASFILVIAYLLASGLFRPAILCSALPLLGLGVALRLPHAYQVSRAGVTIRRSVGARFIPAGEIASVQLKLRQLDGPRLYVNLVLDSGRKVGLIQTGQSAVVIYRALLAMRRVRK